MIAEDVWYTRAMSDGTLRYKQPTVQLLKLAASLSSIKVAGRNLMESVDVVGSGAGRPWADPGRPHKSVRADAGLSQRSAWAVWALSACTCVLRACAVMHMTHIAS